MPTSKLLLLFDIDGTLLGGATRAHADAIHAALHSIHGVNARQVGKVVSPAGRTDPEIVRAILLDAGVSARRIDELADDVREECCRTYARICTADLSHSVLPGIAGLLASLSGREDVIPALLTGNYEPIARLKLARAGIGKYFQAGQGGFGSDAEDRAALVAIARRRAGRGGQPHPRERTVVIGDTPRDIACARADRVRCVAVASGPFSERELADADAVVADGAALRDAIEQLG